MVDLSLSSDRNIPEGFASFSPNFSEDVLLRGGRISNTPDLEPGESITFTEDNLELPDDVPPGDYFLTARVDPAGNVAESDETDNTDLVDLKVLA
jgi:subtilase family serine protease